MSDPDYDAVLDGLVERAAQNDSPELWVHPREARIVLRLIDAPSLVLLLREARDELLTLSSDPDLRPSYDLITRIDAHLAITPQPSTSPADV